MIYHRLCRFSPRYLLLPLTLAVAPIAGADTVTLLPAADSTMYQGSDTRSNGAGEHLFVGRTDESRLRRGLIRFDLSAVPTGSTITSATLTMWVSRTRGPSTGVALHRALAAWGEAGSNAAEEEGEGGTAQPGDATWSHRLFNTSTWTTLGGDFTATASATTNVAGENSSYSWSAAGVGADVQAWVNTPASNFGWVMRGNETSDMTAKRFDTKENSTAQNRPRLVVVFTPPVTCRADFNADGAANSQDFFDFLSAFFAATPEADFNDDGSINSQDFFDFLVAFFAGC